MKSHFSILSFWVATENSSMKYLYCISLCRLLDNLSSISTGTVGHKAGFVLFFSQNTYFRSKHPIEILTSVVIIFIHITCKQYPLSTLY